MVAPWKNPSESFTFSRLSPTLGCWFDSKAFKLFRIKELGLQTHCTRFSDAQLFLPPTENIVPIKAAYIRSFVKRFQRKQDADRPKTDPGMSQKLLGHAVGQQQLPATGRTETPR
jgi:hypothetical protein